METQNEINTQSFTLQRSIAGNSFESITTMHAAVYNAAVNNYSFYDKTAFSQQSGKLYYRLIITDKDGSYTYSPVAIVNIKKVRISIYPNTAKNKIFIRLQSIAGEKALITVADITGSTLISRNIAAALQDYMLDISRLNKGSYSLKIQAGGTKITEVIIKDE